jgi:hypothetical protein
MTHDRRESPLVWLSVRVRTLLLAVAATAGLLAVPSCLLTVWQTLQDTTDYAPGDRSRTEARGESRGRATGPYRARASPRPYRGGFMEKARKGPRQEPTLPEGASVSSDDRSNLWLIDFGVVGPTRARSSGSGAGLGTVQSHNSIHSRPRTGYGPQTAGF